METGEKTRKTVCNLKITVVYYMGIIEVNAKM